jgi:hypothetical protein
MDLTEGFAATVPMIGRKQAGFSVSVAGGGAVRAPCFADRLVWRPPSASRTSDPVGQTPEVHNRL